VAAVAFYVSGHGFGHAIRQFAIIETLLRRGRPDLRVLVRTMAPRWLFEPSVPGRLAVEPAEVDTGVVQIDALRLDERQTIARAHAFYDGLPERAEEEAARLRAHGVELVIADAPPLACAAAARAGVPSIVCGNFTWDWIYSGYREVPGAERVLDAARSSYALADAAWRLPLHGGFESFDTVVDVPLVARHSRTDASRAQLRQRFGLPPGCPLALVSFGGYGVRDLPLDRLDCRGRWEIAVAMPGVLAAHLPPGVHGVPQELICERGLRYEDLVRASDVVITKPGYGIISDCIANGTAMLYTSRGRFAEYDVLVREMPRLVKCGYLEMEAFAAGRWLDGLDRVAAQPEPADRPETNGADVVAGLILERLGAPVHPGCAGADLI
jgi:L-arabinokinase